MAGASSVSLARASDLVGTIVQDVGSLPKAILTLDAGVALVGETQFASGGHDEDGPPDEALWVVVATNILLFCVLSGEDLESSHTLLHVGRSDHQQVGHCSQLGQHLHWLVGRSVLTNIDGVVGADIEDGELGDGSHSNRRQCVLVEDGEQGAVRDQWCGGADAVEDGQGGMLADTKMDVTTGIIRSGQLLTERGGQKMTLDVWPVATTRASDICRAAHHRWVQRYDVLQHLCHVDTPSLVLRLLLRCDLAPLQVLSRIGVIIVRSLNIVPQSLDVGIDGLQLLVEVLGHLCFPLVGQELSRHALLQIVD
mmetsp:Transcript_39705/g.84885  ORF Transcript_39705/g.84885 Transcript_39705/m.84885 type:complete len:310 (-) Transcript_39705:1224-2153(-)